MKLRSFCGISVFLLVSCSGPSKAPSSTESKASPDESQESESNSPQESDSDSPYETVAKSQAILPQCAEGMVPLRNGLCGTVQEREENEQRTLSNIHMEKDPIKNAEAVHEYLEQQTEQIEEADYNLDLILFSLQKKEAK
jgi:hypothetical protein